MDAPFLGRLGMDVCMRVPTESPRAYGARSKTHAMEQHHHKKQKNTKKAKLDAFDASR